MAPPSEMPLRVLLLDDRPAERQACQEQLRDLGHLVVVPSEGQRPSLAEHAADVALLHLGYRGAEGLDALNPLREGAPMVPIVATGSSPWPDFDLAVIEAGAEDFLPEPLDAHRLGVALRLAAIRFRNRTPAPVETAPPARGRLHPLWKLEPGTHLDRYEVERIIGRGGMAVVYRVRHRKLGSVHALKVVLPDAQCQRLIVEGQAQARLRHPNLVRATDILELGDGVGLVMEYVEGPTLSDWMASATAPARQWLRLFRGIVRGLRHAHGLGLVHRDLKPANVLLLETDEGYVPKVADFGIARLMPQVGLPPLTGERTGGIGTVGFVAPEQYADPESVDQRADLFSLGCVLYPLACGTPAFPGRDPATVLDAMMRGDYTPPTHVVPELGPTFEAIIHALLQVDPEHRIKDCQSLLEQLDGLDEARLPHRRPGLSNPSAASTLDRLALDAHSSAWTTGWQPKVPEGPTR
ncbi:MAG: protein kinase [Myxococcota bacterium]